MEHDQNKLASHDPTREEFLKGLPHKPGVYLMRDRTGALIYIGKAIDLRKRIAHYFRADLFDAKLSALRTEIRHIDYIIAESEREALLVERDLIKKVQPIYNVMWRDDKSYPWIRISLGEDFPRVTLTRRKQRDKARYFGPYPRTHAVRRLLRWSLRKKLFPLRPCRYEFSEKKLMDPKVVQSCLYLHTGECPAPCVGKISRRDYHKIAEKAVLFFQGRHDKLEKEWRGQMTKASKAQQYEKAGEFRDKINALEWIREPVTLRAVKPEDVEGRILESQALKDLQARLGLPRLPLKIEAFDISHIQGFETVASMVTFVNGKPDKSGYRKFIIRSVKQVDDFASMREVVARRYGRLKAEGAPFPDLVLIDGGPGQLSSAQSAVKMLECPSFPMASLAKRNEEIFLPGAQNPLVLPRDCAALKLLQYVRDESHRFAVTFHRLRRKKRLLHDPQNNPQEIR